MWDELPKKDKEEYKKMILAFASLTKMFSQKIEDYIGEIWDKTTSFYVKNIRYNWKNINLTLILRYNCNNIKICMEGGI